MTAIQESSRRRFGASPNILKAVKKIKDFSGSFYAEIVQMDAAGLAARLTLILLILYGGKYWYLRVPITVFCACGILTPTLYRSATFWCILSLDLVIGNFLNWYVIDNHKFLMTYWCIALYCTLSMSNPSQSLSCNARVLIGLCFTFAAFSKALSPDYINGSFFHYSLLLDNRFKEVAEILGGVSKEMQLQNQLRLWELTSWNGSINEIYLQDTPATFWLAQTMSWWTILIEGIIALLFLWPNPKAIIEHLRNFLLIAFALTTYSVAPVVGFGWLLMIMGLAQCSPNHLRTRFIYFVSFFIVQIYTVPWKYLV